MPLDEDDFSEKHFRNIDCSHADLLNLLNGFEIEIR
jgi:hypothetical protein